VRTAQARGVALPEDFVRLVEKAHEMYLYAAQPDHILPMFNDCGTQPTDPAPYLRGAAQMFPRADFLWGASHGQPALGPVQGKGPRPITPRTRGPRPATM